MFELLITKNFDSELKKLENKERERVKKKLKKVREDPWQYFQRLTVHGFFRARIGKYIIIAQINSAEKQIMLLSVKHRKNVYKSF